MTDLGYKTLDHKILLKEGGKTSFPLVEWTSLSKLQEILGEQALLVVINKGLRPIYLKTIRGGIKEGKDRPRILADQLGWLPPAPKPKKVKKPKGGILWEQLDLLYQEILSETKS